MIAIDVDLRQLDDIRGQLEATPKEAETAFNRAVLRIASQVRTRSVRVLQRRLGLRSQRRLRNRWRLYRRQGPNGVGRRIFAGAYPLTQAALTTEPQLRRQVGRREGITIGGRTYSRAFVAVVRGRYGAYERQEDRTLRRIRIDISDETAEVLREEWGDVPAALYNRFEQELSFIANRRLGRT